jgi:hypothetical protein
VAIGTAVIGGMLSATALAILFVPLFFVLIAGKARPPVERQELHDPDEDARLEDAEEQARLAAAAAPGGSHA